MKRPRLRALWRRLRPGTMRMRLTLLTAGITVIPLTVGAFLVGANFKTSLFEEARRTSAEWFPASPDWARVAPPCNQRLKSWCILPSGQFQHVLGSATEFPPCTQRPVLDRARGQYRFTVCQATRGPNAVTNETLQPKLSLIPWTDPQEASFMWSGYISTKMTTGPDGSYTGVEFLAVIRSIEVYQARLNTIMWSLTGSVLGLTFLIAASTWLTVGFVLRPVEAIRAEFADLSAHHLDRRVPVPRAGNEIARLATTMNDTLDRLETAVDQQRRFVADASHELRTPLAALRAELELALNRPESAHWPQVVSDALGDTLRLQHLTTDFLLLARLDAASTDAPNSRLFDITELIRDELVRRRLPAHLTLVPHIEPGPVTVHGSSTLLSRVLGNLLDNAVRHATSTIAVRLTHHLDERAVVLDVQDDGPGIPLEDHQRIFERFTRLDEARTHDAGGTGLGLAIAHRITTLHHGTLTLQPASPGAHFTLRLPTTTR